MDYSEEEFSDIKSIDKNGITFADGKCIVFSECINQRYNSDTCVAERDCSADPPYFEFFTPVLPTRIVFKKTGFRAKSKNLSDFISLQSKISETGYGTYDLT